jgi:hypothetical protein
LIDKGGFARRPLRGTAANSSIYWAALPAALFAAQPRIHPPPRAAPRGSLVENLCS